LLILTQCCGRRATWPNKESASKMTKRKKRIFATPAAAIANPVNPRMAAINATTKKTNAQRNMMRSSTIALLPRIQERMEAASFVPATDARFGTPTNGHATLHWPYSRQRIPQRIASTREATARKQGRSLKLATCATRQRASGPRIRPSEARQNGLTLQRKIAAGHVKTSANGSPRSSRTRTFRTI